MNSLITTTASLALLSSAASAANIIAINLTRTAAITPAANDGSEYGISTWVNVAAADQALTTDGVSFTWDSGGGWSGGGNNVENGYLDNAGSFTATGLAAWLTTNGATEYTIQLVQATDTATQWFGDTELRDSTAGGTILATLTNSNLHRGATSVSGNLSANSLFIDPTNMGTAPAGGSTARTNTAGIIIRAVPEPSSTLLMGLGVFALLMRRKV